MDKFVCVRMVQGNGMDLTLFQFDYDLTFAAFFLNADRTIYGRFGSRSERKDATKDVSIEGFRKALVAALELHKKYPANQASLAGKQSRPPRFKTPEEYPSLRGKYKLNLDYEGKVVQLYALPSLARCGADCFPRPSETNSRRSDLSVADAGGDRLDRRSE